MSVADWSREDRELVWGYQRPHLADAGELIARIERVMSGDRADAQYVLDKTWRAFGELVEVLAIAGAEEQGLLNELRDRFTYGFTVHAELARERATW